MQGALVISPSHRASTPISIGFEPLSRGIYADRGKASSRVAAFVSRGLGETPPGWARKRMGGCCPDGAWGAGRPCAGFGWRMEAPGALGLGARTPLSGDD